MPFVLRFQATACGAITFTGNAAGLSKLGAASVEHGPTASQGAFMCAGESDAFSGYPVGTTASFELSRSCAVLRLPSASRVLHAEMIWAGTTVVSQGGPSVVIAVQDMTDQMNGPIRLRTPSGQMMDIYPELHASSGFAGTIAVAPPESPGGSTSTQYYVRTSNVTDLVREGGAGIYCVEGIPSTLFQGVETTPGMQNAGWTLAVAYEHAELPLRHLAIYSASEPVRPGKPSDVAELTGFTLPSDGPLAGRLAISAIGGNAAMDGDVVLFGSENPPLEVLFGPNNPMMNFFQSQLNGDDGLLDTSGSFGDRNYVTGTPNGSPTSACRQGYDITSIDVQPFLTNDQTSFYLQGITEQDCYLINAVGLQLDSYTPRISIVLSADQPDCVVGDVVTYCASIFHQEENAVCEATLSVLLPRETSLVPRSISINRVPQADLNTLSCIELKLKEADSVTTVSYRVRIDEMPESELLILTNSIYYRLIKLPYGYSKPLTELQKSKLNANINMPSFSRYIHSNAVHTPVYKPELHIEICASNSGVTLLEPTEYTIQLQNKGDVSFTEVVVADCLPSHSTFVAGSVSIDGESRAGDDPALGIIIRDLTPGDAAEIKLRASAGHVGDLGNVCTASYHFRTPNGRLGRGTAISNAVSTAIVSDTVSSVHERMSISAAALFVDESPAPAEAAPDLIAIHTSNVNYVSLGGAFTCTIELINQTSEPLTDIRLENIVPTGTAFVPDSLLIDNVHKPSSNLEGGIDAGALPPAATFMIMYKVYVYSLSQSQPVNGGTVHLVSPAGPKSYPIATFSNPVYSANVEIDIQSSIGNENDDGYVELDSDSSADTLVFLNDVVMYNVSVINNGNAPSHRTLFQVTSPDCAQLVAGSVKIADLPQSAGVSLNNLDLGTIAPGQSVSLAYQYRIVEIPHPPEWRHMASVHFTTKLPDGHEIPFSRSTVTDIIPIHSSRASIALQFIRGPYELMVGQSTDVIMLIWNSGTAAAKNVRIWFAVPSGLSIIPDSVLVDDMRTGSDDPIVGIPIAVIEPGQEISVHFKIFTAFRPFVDNPILKASLDADCTDDDGKRLTIEPIVEMIALVFKTQ